MAEILKPIIWVGDSRKALGAFPRPVRDEIGYALYNGQLGEPHPSARTMKGLPAVEIVSDCDGDTFRGIYTTRHKGHVFVLHCFQKKSKKGAATPKPELDLIRKRLKDAETIHKSLSKGRRLP